MRAKFAFAAAVLGVVATLAPVTATELNADVHDILYGGVGYLNARDFQPVVTTQSAVIETTPIVVQTELTPMVGTTVITQQVVLAPGTIAIVSDGPSDLDIRREQLSLHISECLASGALNAAEAADLRSGIGQVESAELAMRASAGLDNKEGKRLYKAMDKVASDMDWYMHDDSNRLLGFRMNPWL